MRILQTLRAFRKPAGFRELAAPLLRYTLFMSTNRFLPRDKASELLQVIRTSDINMEYDPEKHRLTLLDKTGMEQLHFRLPITLPYTEAGRTEDVNMSYVILLIQAGNCAMGYFENGRCLNHKVFRSYMVRKKQGKSQIKYLKTKGKSRAGSRVRLGETAEFFENINGRLQEYFQEHRIDRIAISCSKTLLPYLYNAAVPTPFDKRDPRLFKIPRHIHTPIHQVLLDTNRFLQRGELIFLTDTSQETLAPALSGLALEDFLLKDPDQEVAAKYLNDSEDEVYVTDEWDEEDGEFYSDEDEDDDIVDWD